jgi:hypothetical protein
MTAASQPYPSDLSDQEWAFLAPVLPPAKPGGRPRSVDLRQICVRSASDLQRPLSRVAQWLPMASNAARVRPVVHPLCVLAEVAQGRDVGADPPHHVRAGATTPRAAAHPQRRDH